MNILARINARKIVLSYLYKQCFFLKFEKQDKIISELLFLSGVYESHKEEFIATKKDFLKEIIKYSKEDLDEDISYIVKHFFDKWDIKNIDMDYILTVLGAYKKYISKIPKVIDKYTKTFSYDEMTSVNQALFVLGYIEWKELKTVKNVLLNELVELAKRYDDAGSPKLVNAVMHKVFEK